MARTPRRGGTPPAPLQLCKREQAPPTVAAPPEGAAPLVINPRPAANPQSEIAKARAIAAGLAVRSVQRLGELVECADGRVALVAAEAVRKWVEEPAKGGKMADQAYNPETDSYPAVMARNERAMALREGLRGLMPNATEAEFWEELAARLISAGLNVTDAFAIEEIESGVMRDLGKEPWPNLPPLDKLPLPLRDETFRRRIDPRYAERAATAEPERPSKEALDELMKDLGPKEPLN